VNNLQRDDMIGGIIAVLMVAGLELVSGIPIQVWAVSVVVTAGLAGLGARQSRKALERGPEPV
jgi:hypothetical protein